MSGSMGKGLGPEVALDQHGWPTIVGGIIISEVPVDEDEVLVDEDGCPTIFGDIIISEVPVDEDAPIHDDDSVPSIKPVNHNV